MIHSYDKKNRAMARSNVDPKGDLTPKLTPKAKKHFDFFVSQANKTSLHPADWQLFYGFIRLCHGQRSRMREGDIVHLLASSGFDEQHAKHIASIYDHGRRILGHPLGYPDYICDEMLKEHQKTIDGGLGDKIH